jgi:hypothetical protein
VAAADSSSDSVKEYYPFNDQHEDLKPSTAPFPAADSPANPSSVYSESTPASAVESVKQSSEPLPTVEPDEESGETLSPESIAFTLPESTFKYPLMDNTYFQTQQQCEFPVEMAIANSEDHSQSGLGHLTLTIPNHPSSTIQETTNSLAAFATFPDMIRQDDIPVQVDQIAQQFLLDPNAQGQQHHHVHIKLEDQTPLHLETRQQYEQIIQEVVARSPASADDGAFKPPPSIDIAARRNMRRPAPLGTGALRSHSYNHPGPRTGIEMVKRNDAASPMRRIASATGNGNMPGRVQKSIGAGPRSPLFYERNHEALLHLARSPVVAAPTNPFAPPTPNTPVLTNRQGIREATVSSTSSDDDKSYNFQMVMPDNPFLMDPTLRTPPATPGIMGHYSGAGFANVESAFVEDYTDEQIVTPGLGGFGIEPDFSSMAQSIPSYVANSCASQPSTPSFAPMAMGGMGNPLFATASSSNIEYAWPNAAMSSSKSSPGQPKSKQFQFITNVTPDNFNSDK